MQISKDALSRELKYKTSRSGGKGGQNVNKVSSKVELNWNVNESELFSEIEKERINTKLQGRINSEGILQVITEEERSQYLNKEKSIDKLILLLIKALHVPKKRKKSKPKKSAIEKRLKSKQIQSLKKISRKNTNPNDY